MAVVRVRNGNMSCASKTTAAQSIYCHGFEKVEARSYGKQLKAPLPRGVASAEQKTSNFGLGRGMHIR